MLNSCFNVSLSVNTDYSVLIILVFLINSVYCNAVKQENAFLLKNIKTLGLQGDIYKYFVDFG